MAKRATSVYICQQCGFKSSQYLGKCPECGSWNSLVETLETTQTTNSSSKNLRINNLPKIITLDKIEKVDYKRIPTNLAEFDRVLGGGIVPGSVVLVAGDPGIGKSTLLSQLAVNIPKTLYVAGEESAHQIKLRVERIKPKADLAVLNEVDVDVINAVIENVKPPLVIIDSIQTLQTTDLNSIAGSVGQVRESSHRIQQLAKRLKIPIFIVGHVTKEGTIAGPKTLEHLVDVVLNLEGESTSNLRLLRTTKNRFGATDEVGIFEMEESGMIEVNNPSKLFLDQKVNAPGSTVVCVINGLRPLLIEIQALVTKSYLPIPRRVGTGIDNNRLQLLVAVLSKRLNLPLGDQDIFVNVTGGIKINEPAIDLGICMAIASSLKDKSITQKTVFIGEVGLLGELRSVRQLDRRANESKKLGYTNIISPQTSQSLIDVIKQAFSK